MRLEPEFWDALGLIADEQGVDLSTLVRRIRTRPGERTSNVRVYVLRWYQRKVA